MQIPGQPSCNPYACISTSIFIPLEKIGHKP